MSTAVLGFHRFATFCARRIMYKSLRPKTRPCSRICSSQFVVMCTFTWKSHRVQLIFLKNWTASHQVMSAYNKPNETTFKHILSRTNACAVKLLWLCTFSSLASHWRRMKHEIENDSPQATQTGMLSSLNWSWSHAAVWPVSPSPEWRPCRKQLSFIFVASFLPVFVLCFQAKCMCMPTDAMWQKTWPTMLDCTRKMKPLSFLKWCNFLSLFLGLPFKYLWVFCCAKCSHFFITFFNDLATLHMLFPSMRACPLSHEGGKGLSTLQLLPFFLTLLTVLTDSAKADTVGCILLKAVNLI